MDPLKGAFVKAIVAALLKKEAVVETPSLEMEFNNNSGLWFKVSANDVKITIRPDRTAE